MRRKRLTIKPIDRIEGLKTYANLVKEELEWFKEEALQNARLTAENLLNQLISDLNDFKEIQKLLDNKKLQAREKEEQLQAQLKKFNFQVLNDLRRIVSALVRSPMYRRERDDKANTYFVFYVNQLNNYPKADLVNVIFKLSSTATNLGINTTNGSSKVTDEVLQIIKEKNPSRSKPKTSPLPKVLLEESEGNENIYPSINEKLRALIDNRFIHFPSIKEDPILNNLYDCLETENNEENFKEQVKAYLSIINNSEQEEFAKELLKLIAQVDMTYVRNLCKEDLNRYCKARKQEAKDDLYSDLKYHHHGFFGKVLGAFGFGISAQTKISAAGKIINYIDANEWDQSAGLTVEDFDALTDSRLGGIMHFYDEIGIFSGTNIFEKEENLQDSKSNFVI